MKRNQHGSLTAASRASLPPGESCSYVGRHAELYDLFYADKPYAEEAGFVDRCLQKFGLVPARNILELACGTGRHAVELEKLGYNVTATDYSPDMLRVARERASKTGSKIKFVAGDMRALELPAPEYDATICLFDSIGYLKTNDALGEALERIQDHLRPGGLFICEFWHAEAMLAHYSPLRIRRWKKTAGEVIRISETALDPQNQLANVDYTIYELNENGTYSTFRETHTNRYFSTEEMQALLSTAKFEVVKFFAGFRDDESIDADTWHVVVIARKLPQPDKAGS